MAKVANRVTVEKSNYNGRWYITITTTDDCEFKFLVRLYWLKSLLHKIVKIDEIHEDD
jgi:hypothetical protein